MEKNKKIELALSLTAEDYENLIEKCDRLNWNVNELIEAFLQDLVCSIHSNGSDEKESANAWFFCNLVKRAFKL